MRKSLLACLAAFAVFGQSNGGIAPQPHSTDYPAQQTSGDVTVAAALLTPAEAKKVFTADLDHAGFLVLEVAVYPSNGAQIDLAPDQFTLRIANDPAIVPTSSPDSIVEVMYKGKRSTPQLPDKVHVYTSTSVGYESGGAGRKGGVYTGTDTTVIVGDPPYPPPPATSKAPPTVDRDTLQVELAAREFPNAKSTDPVAGYLYFAKPRAKPKNGIYELTCNMGHLSGQQIVVPVPAKSQ